MEWVTYISALLLVIDFDKCQEDTGIRMVSENNTPCKTIYILIWKKVGGKYIHI